MIVILRLFQFYFPRFLKKKRLEKLFAVTSQAFDCKPPETKGLTYKQCLHHYALFTKQQTEKYINEGYNIHTLKERLYQGAYQLGKELRMEFNITTSQDVILMCEIIYDMLGIDFRSYGKNQIIIKKCFFSQYYSSEICQVISSLDEGVAAGLSDGGSLSFYQRITEGNDCCRANFIMEEYSK
ncbi:MAG: hypothetical protein K0R31_364 [Clostridiales bacterium]|jgi:hypothetical protein|nr:hypothetical protein [Clostridiales bacterium]